MIITLLTAASEQYWPLMQKTGPNKMEYCLRHGYELLMRTHGPFQGRWGERERFMHDALKNGACDWLAFFGADTLITNMTIKLETIIDDNFDFIIAADVHGINNDVFLMRNCFQSLNFISHVASLSNRHPNDQSAMFEVMHSMAGYRSKVLHEQRIMNSMPYAEYGMPEDAGRWQEGDLCFHAPGLTLERRMELIDEHLAKVVR